MTRTEIERLTALETQVENLCGAVERIEAKLDNAIEQKADKSSVDRLERFVIGIIVAVAGTAVTTLAGLGVFLLQGHVK